MLPTPPKRELPGIAFEEVDTPLREALSFYLETLQQDIASGKLKSESAWSCVHGFALCTQQGYAGVLALLDEKRKLRLQVQASVIQRSVLEILANLMAIFEDLEPRQLWLMRENYKSLALRFERDKADFGSDPAHTAYFDAFEAFLNLRQDALNLSADERKDPTIIQEWPTPGKLLFGVKNRNVAPMITGNRGDALKVLYRRHYSSLSEHAHQRAAAIALGLIVRDPSKQWNPGYGESAIIGSTAFFAACVLSEIQAEGRYPKHPGLTAAWAALRKMDLEAQELWKLRYEKL